MAHFEYRIDFWPAYLILFSLFFFDSPVYSRPSVAEKSDNCCLRTSIKAIFFVGLADFETFSRYLTICFRPKSQHDDKLTIKIKINQRLLQPGIFDHLFVSLLLVYIFSFTTSVSAFRWRHYFHWAWTFTINLTITTNYASTYNSWGS